jgi:hypothetical protein
MAALTLKVPDAAQGVVPPDQIQGLDVVMEAVWRTRFSMFAFVAVQLQSMMPDLCVTSGFIDDSLAVLGADPEYRRRLVNDPAFLVWIKLAIRALNRAATGSMRDKREVRRIIEEFPKMRHRCDTRLEADQAYAIAGTRVAVQRFDIDPLIAKITPPTYRFTASDRKRQELLRGGHSRLFFRDVTTIAMERIKRTWPECHQLISALTRVICYVPDGDFRSCSAARYVGVIYVGSSDDSLLDLEESLVHEAGHQLLYSIVEIEAVTEDQDSGLAEYTLPWSGRTRDLYGYFHAFYIYTLLARYYDRVVSLGAGDRTDDELQRARQRLLSIIDGLIRAEGDFAEEAALTRKGLELVVGLTSQITWLEQKYRPWLETPQTRRKHSVSEA